MKRGDKVKTVYGVTETVMAVEESRVVTYESAQRGNWWHPTKVWNIGDSTDREGR